MTRKTKSNEVTVDGAKVKARRDECGFTQDGLAYRMTASPATVSRIEAGGPVIVEHYTAGRLAKALRVKLAELLPEAGDGK